MSGHDEYHNGGGSVQPLFAHQPQDLIDHVRSYWDGLRDARDVPDRSDITPTGIGAALEYAFLLERVAMGAARFRLAGQHLIDLMGMEVRGMPLCTLVNPGSRGRLSDVLETVFRAPQIAQLSLHAPADYGRPELQAQVILLPLRSDLGDVTRALGCLVAHPAPGLAPRRFDLADDAVLPILPGGITMEPSPSLTPRRPVRSRAQPDSETPAPQPPVNRLDSTEKRRAMFRVISND
ncbi:PAS domain-containing protein [Paracoccus sp. (in: a-proteobacteria)]|uniref:PAS domain-containing protein n=1 Tax=Paracoccus sp. TaxID=267 RepID=UPI0026DF8C31|nr:PAS domain-containing protein [Paracoccus sp. (in: a-proteobacteria)]MDO5646636.1 PAS domain-containing protein [Paracoccus sp. (in: a-proteobacteria)]